MLTKVGIGLAAAGVALSSVAGYVISETNEAGVVTLAFSKTPGSTSIEFHVHESFAAPEVTKLELTHEDGFTPVCYFEPTNGVNTFVGGILGGDFQIRYNGLQSVEGTFGVGPIAFASTNVSEAGAIYATADLDLPNRVVVNRGTWFASDGKKVLTLRNVGFTEANENRVLALGRTTTEAASANVLSITNSASEAIGSIRLRGLLDLTIENLIACADVGGDTLFAIPYGTPDVHVSTRGVTFDVPAGRTVRMGVPLRMDPAEMRLAVVETALPANNSFESGTNGWQTAKEEGQTQSIPGVLASPHTTWCKYVTTDETTDANGKKHVLCLRWKESAQTENPVSLPTAGKWRVSFLSATRHDSGGGSKIPITVTVDPGLDTERSHVFPSRYQEVGGTTYDYRRLTTEGFELSAGEHHLRLATGVDPNGGTKTDYTALMFDDIRFERVEEVVERPEGTIAKTGAGTLTMSGVTTMGTVDVRDGELGMDTYDLLSPATVKVAAGAKLSLVDTGIPDCVQNGSFEADGEQTNLNNQNDPANWTRSITKERGQVNSGQAGLQGNGGNCSKTASWTTAGTATCYLRECTALTQTIDIPKAGVYTLIFSEAYRSDYAGNKLPLTISIGGKEVCSLTATSCEVFTRHQVSVELEAGPQDLVVHLGDDSRTTAAQAQGALVFVDDIRLIPDLTEVLHSAQVELARGATIRFDNEFPVVFEKPIRVEGVEVIGRRAQLEAAGVTVEGEGKFRSGTAPLGMTILVK